MSGHAVADHMLLRLINKSLMRLSFAGLGFLLYSSQYALADFVGFPGAEYDGGVITVLGYQTQNFENGPTNGPRSLQKSADLILWV